MRDIRLSFCLCLSLLFLGCQNESGDSNTPEVTKYLDAQIDGNIAATNEVRADSPKVAMAVAARGITRTFVAWMDHRLGDRNVFFNCRDNDLAWTHPNDLQIDTGLRKGGFYDQMDMATSSDGTYVHVVWADQKPGQETVYYNFSKDGGQTFQAKAQALCPGWPFNYRSTEPHIVCSADGKIVYVAYRYGMADVALRYSEQGGEPGSWQNDPISNIDTFFVRSANRGAGLAKDISLDCDREGKYCHLVWQGTLYDGTQYRTCFFYRCWNNTLKNWVTAETGSYYSDSQLHRPQVKCSNNIAGIYTAHIGVLRYNPLWQWRGIFHWVTTDFGVTLSAPALIGTSNGYSFFPNLYCNRDTGEACAIWEDCNTGVNPVSWQVFANTYTGGSWQGSVQTLSAISFRNNRYLVFPQIAGTGNNVYAAWVDFSDPSNPYLYCNNSTDLGLTWTSSTGVKLSNTGGSPTYLLKWPSLAATVDGGVNKVYAAWGEKRGRNMPQVFGGDPLIAGSETVLPHHLTAVRQHAFEPRIAANGNQVFGVWLADRYGGEDVFFSRSQDNGNNWVEDFLINQSQGEYCKNLQMQADSNSNVYLVWEKTGVAKSTYNPTNIGDDPVGHFLGAEKGTMLFQRFAFGTVAASSPAPATLGNDLPASAQVFTKERRGDGLMRALPESKPIPARNVVQLPSLPHDHVRALKQYAARSEELEENRDSRNPILAFNKESWLYVLYDSSNDYTLSRVDLFQSKDRGISWKGIVGVAFWTSRREMLNADMLAARQYLYLVEEVRGEYLSHSQSEIYFLRVNDGVFPPEAYEWLDQGDDFFAHQSSQPRIAKDQATDKDRLFVAWTEFRAGSQPDIFCNYSINNGTSWQSAAVPVYLDDTDATASGRVRLCSGNKVFYCVWHRYDPATDRFSVFFNSIMVDDADNFSIGIARQLDSGKGSAMNPEIVNEGDSVYVMWQDTASGASDILVRSSADRGNTWTNEVRFNTNDIGTGYAGNPRGAIAGNLAYVLWEDYRSGKNVHFEARQR